MEELLLKGYLYRFKMSGTRQFTARFDEISGTGNTLFVTEYTDENGHVPGVRTLPFQWIKGIELIEEEHNEIETISLDTVTPTKNGRKKSKPPKMVNNFID